MKSSFAVLFSMVLFTGTVAMATSPVVKPLTEIDAIAEAHKYDMGCNEFNTEIEPRFAQKIVHKFSYSYDTKSDPERSVEYFVVSCPAGAYNTNSMLFRVDRYENRLAPVALALPRLNTKDQVTGWTADVVLGDLNYEEKTGTLTSFSKGRGIGDLYAMGTYRLFEEDVVLVKYFLDNTEGDGEAPGTVYESKLPLNF